MTVEPIRDRQKIKNMSYYLNGKNPKYGLLFKFGLNTGLRISDILPVRIEDIYKCNKVFKDYFILKEKKTGKEKKIKINTSLRKAINNYLETRLDSSSSYLFYSNKADHISRIQAYRVLREAAEFCGIENFGTHSLRKTWGYWTYKMTKFNIGLIMDTFNHSSQSITLRYIGVNQDQKDELYSLVQF
jgi:integrase